MESQDVRTFLRNSDRLFLHNDALYRTSTLDGQQVKQLVIPDAYRQVALRGVHDDAGHQGKEKTLWLARQRFYWPGLESDVTQWVRQCDRCIRRKTPTKRPFAELSPIHTTRPMELVSIDFLKLEPSKGGVENILVIVDHFTRFAQAIPCRNQTAATTAKALYEGYFRYYGFPEQLHSDQGRNFLSRTIQELCKVAGIRKSRTTPYHAMGNGSSERWNQTLLKMLGTLENHQKADWKSYIAPLVQAYNASRNDSTGFAPHYLMFGWHPRLPVDAYLGTDPSEEHTGSHSTYASKLHQRLQYAFRKAAEEAGKTAGKNKRNYDLTVKHSKIDVGDQVLIRKVGLKGTNKLADNWDEEVYTVLSMPNPDIPVYRVQKIDTRGPIKTLHRNMLLPYSPQVTKGFVEPASEGYFRKKKPVTSRSMVDKSSLKVNSSSESSDSSDSDSVPRYVPPHLRRARNQIPVCRDPGPPPSPIQVSVPSQVPEVTPQLSEVVVPVEFSHTADSNQHSADSFTLVSQQPDSPVPDSPVRNSPLPVKTPRPVRRRAPPVRYGEWVSSITDLEVFV